ncbi:MAG: hypothetical protein WKG07_15830, partial [Hymenobacter sp.]
MVPIMRPSRSNGRPMLAGTVLLTLSLKQLSSYSVLPELLVDQKFFQPGLATDLSYAGYAQGPAGAREGDSTTPTCCPRRCYAIPKSTRTGWWSAIFTSWPCRCQRPARGSHHHGHLLGGRLVFQLFLSIAAQCGAVAAGGR